MVQVTICLPLSPFLLTISSYSFVVFLWNVRARDIIPGMSRANEDEVLSPFCPAYTHAIEIVGRRWTGAIVRSMLSGASRFSEILAAVPGLSDRLLSERLKELESEGIVRRRVTPSTPVRIEYELTEKGRDLATVVRAVAEWAETWAKPDRPSTARTG